MAEDTTHVRIYESDKDRLRLTTTGKMPVTLHQLISERWSHSDHDPTVKESNSGSKYILCEECGRTENHLSDLNTRPCEDGISVKE